MRLSVSDSLRYKFYRSFHSDTFVRDFLSTVLRLSKKSKALSPPALSSFFRHVRIELYDRPVSLTRKLCPANDNTFLCETETTETERSSFRIISRPVSLNRRDDKINLLARILVESLRARVRKRRNADVVLVLSVTIREKKKKCIRWVITMHSFVIN